MTNTISEAEISLKVALFFLKNQLTDSDISVSLDGAHIKTGDTIHFDIWTFFKKIHAVKIFGDDNKWQGTYQLPNIKPNLIIHSQPGCGDVIINLHTGKRMYIESKKGCAIKTKSNQEYGLLREAIGQLMTGFNFNEYTIPAVAIPYTPKNLELTTKWSQYSQIKQLGIQFLLVNTEGDVVQI